MKSFSIILPFYNVEKYIAQCLDSLLKQDIPHEEYEIVCVNDCSPDHSEDIVRQYMQQYPNVRLIKHEQNKRLGGARNTGIQHAKGKYIWFVDSDDTIRENCLSALLKELDDNPDMLLFNYEIMDDRRNILNVEKVFKDSYCIKGLDYVKSFLPHIEYHLGYAWRMCCRTEYLRKNNIYFPEHVLWEDTVFFPKAILLADSIKSISAVLYQYRQNPQSICQTYNRGIQADTMIQFAFITGNELLQFANEYASVDAHIAHNLRKKAVDGYINAVCLSLVRTSREERSKFYQLIRKNASYKALIASLHSVMKPLTKWLLLPYIGHLSADVLACVYKLKKERKYDTKSFDNCAHL